MKKPMLLTVAVACGLLLVIVSVLVGPAAHAQEFVPPAVFQAAGPTVESDQDVIFSIQSAVDAFRAALGDPNNGNNPGPLPSGRREINWDGGGANTTTPPVTPFNVFLRMGQTEALQASSAIRPTPPSSAPLALCACSPQSAATSPRRYSSYLAPMERPQRWSGDLALSSQTLTSRMGAGQAGSAATAGLAR
jgi:hypothetical protein